MIYILDAYNVIHKIPSLEKLADKDLRTSREALIHLVTRLAARGDTTKIILVFDGQTQYHDLANSAPPKIKLIYSNTNEDADDRIAVVLESLPERPIRIVVSDDNSVRNHARAYKASPMSVAKFETLLNQTPKKAPQKKTTPRQSSTLPSRC